MHGLRSMVVLLRRNSTSIRRLLHRAVSWYDGGRVWSRSNVETHLRSRRSHGRHGRRSTGKPDVKQRTHSKRGSVAKRVSIFVNGAPLRKMLKHRSEVQFARQYLALELKHLRGKLKDRGGAQILRSDVRAFPYGMGSLSKRSASLLHRSVNETRKKAWVTRKRKYGKSGRKPGGSIKKRKRS